MDYWSYKSCKAPVKSSPPTSSFFTGWMPFLLPNQQCQSTEGKTSVIHLELVNSSPVKILYLAMHSLYSPGQKRSAVVVCPANTTFFNSLTLPTCQGLCGLWCMRFILSSSFFAEAKLSLASASLVIHLRMTMFHIHVTSATTCNVLHINT